MKDLALAASVIFGGSMIIGGIVGNRVASHYGKSKIGGTIIGVAVGYIALVGYVRYKSKVDMEKMLKEQSQNTIELQKK
jgi:hypothetical protein